MPKTTFSSFLHKKLCFLLCFSCICNSYGATTTQSSTPSETLAQTDITKVGMNMFTTAYEWEIGSALGYNSDALKDIEKKLNSMIPTKIPAFVDACKGCSEFIKPGFSDALATFLKKTHNKTGNVGYFNVAKPFFDENILKAPLKDDTVRKFDLLVETTVGKIAKQVIEQMNNFRDVSGMGLYFDGDTTNSPYDLLDDLRRIDEIFFRTAPGYGDYKNSSKDDVSALITGQVKQGAWVGGENYNIDLLGDIDESLGGSDDDEGKINDSAEGGAGDCSEGYCVTVDFIQNTHYFLSGTAQSPGSSSGGSSSSGSSGSSGGSGMNNNSFQAIFEEGLEWIIKHGDKRNFACKAAPTINEYESNDNASLKLSEIFTGLGIHTFWKTPPFLLSFIERRIATNTPSESSSNGSTQTKEDKATEDALRAAFARNGVDYDHPTNLKSNTKLTYISAAMNDGNHRDVKGIDLAEGQKKGAELYESSLVEKGKGSERLLLHQESTDTIKHIEKTFDDILSRVRMLRDYNDGLNKVLKYLKEKKDCTN